MAETELESKRQSGPAEPILDVSADPRSRLIVPAIILVHLSITTVLAFKLNIWIDEAFSLHTTARGVGYALRQALNFELQAPLYFVILSIWRKVDSSIFFARMYSVASVALSLAVLATLSKRLWKAAHPGWIVAAVALNPLTIAVAVDVRLYAQAMLISALLLLTFYDGYLAQNRRRRSQVFYVLLAVAALYTQYYTGFLLLGNACALLVLRRWRALLQYLIGMVVTGLCFIPMVPFIRYQMSAHTAPILNPGSLWVVFKAVTWRMKEYVLPVGWDVSLVARSWILRICYATALVILYKKRRSLTPELIAFWAISLAVALCFLVVARWQGETLLQTRHTIVLFFPINAAVFSIVHLANNRKIALGWTVLVLVFCLAGVYLNNRTMAKPGDWKRVGAHLMNSEAADQPILVFHAGAALPLSHYYNGRNLLVPVPKNNTFERFDFHDYVLRDEREILELLKRIPGSHERIWVVTDEQCGFADLLYHCDILEEFISKYYVVEDSRSFRNSMVRLLRRR